jgi:hypothetical protein
LRFCAAPVLTGMPLAVVGGVDEAASGGLDVDGPGVP